MTFRVLTQIDEETRARHAEADTQRLAIMTEPATPRLYRRFLLRLHGFESPVESALQSTPALADLIDLRARLHSRLLRSDLAALGIVDLTRVTRCAAVPRFRHVLEALGWMYVIERGRMLHSILHRHLSVTLPALAAVAAAYLSAERSAARRMRELGATLDSAVRSEDDVERILAAAHGAFQALALWNTEARPPRQRVASSVSAPARRRIRAARHARRACRR
jgi:heme oxygenase